MVRIDKVYTKAGDGGETSLIGGERVAKSSPRIECYGTVDELNAAIGLVQCSLGSPSAAELSPILERVQNELFNLGSLLATPDPERRKKAPQIGGRHIEALEADLDRLNEKLPELKSFVLPGGGLASAHLHLARTICRRAERHCVALAANEDIGEHLVAYLNRLSDALFVFGRFAAVSSGESEVLWKPEQT